MFCSMRGSHASEAFLGYTFKLANFLLARLTSESWLRQEQDPSPLSPEVTQSTCEPRVQDHISFQLLALYSESHSSSHKLFCSIKLKNSTRNNLTYEQEDHIMRCHMLETMAQTIHMAHWSAIAMEPSKKHAIRRGSTRNSQSQLKPESLHERSTCSQYIYIYICILVIINTLTKLVPILFKKVFFEADFQLNLLCKIKISIQT